LHADMQDPLNQHYGVIGWQFGTRK
jgi:hypothetical protein